MRLTYTYRPTAYGAGVDEEWSHQLDGSVFGDELPAELLAGFPREGRLIVTVEHESVPAAEVAALHSAFEAHMAEKAERRRLDIKAQQSRALSIKKEKLLADRQAMVAAIKEALADPEMRAVLKALTDAGD